MEKVNPVNAWGESFWERHFKVFGFIKYVISIFLDFVEDKMRSPELSALLAGYYLLSVNTALLGIYRATAFCEPFFPDYLSVPDYLMITKSPFSVYSHFFYPLIFIGNLERSPFFIVLTCAAYCTYDFMLAFVDVTLT
jgi:hypothetical protein